MSILYSCFVLLIFSYVLIVTSIGVIVGVSLILVIL